MQVRRRGQSLERRLRQRFDTHPRAGDIRGRGLFYSVELVRERNGKQPFDPALNLHARVKAAALARGLACHPVAGCVDGRAGDHVLLAPPYIISDAELEEAVGKLGDAVDAALAGVN